MAEEIPDNISDPGQKPTFPFPEHIEYTKKIPASEGHLERFFQRINLLFKGQASPPNPLQGRIHELQSNADTALAHLIKAKEDLETKSGDQAFNGLLNSVLDPFIKEIMRIQRAMDQDSSTPHQVKVSSRYSEWIEKAKWWTEACSQFESAEAACPVLLAHAVEEVHARIDRDIQFLQDYFNHSIQTLGLTASSQEEVDGRLSAELGLHLTALHQLKTALPEEAVDAFYVWRADVDHLREKCLTEALHSIDTVSNDINPVQKTPKGHEHAGDVHPELRNSILKLEDKQAELLEQIENFPVMDSRQKKQYLLHLDLLAEEANRLNGDLRLPPEQSDSLQYILETLAAIRQQIAEH